MPRNGSGNYTPPGSSFPAVASTLIESAKFNNIINDIATAISGSIASNGETTVTANIPFGGNKLTGVGAATARTDAATLASIQDGTGVYVGTVGGTADAITLTPSPAITAYATGQKFVFMAGGTSTGAVTVAISGLATKAIQASGSALAGGEIVSGKLYGIRYDGTQFQLECISVTPFIATLLNDPDASTARTTLGAAAAFPSGTKMLFQQTSAPTGWTKDTTHNNKALRIVSGTVGSGGATAFTSVFGSGKSTGSYTLQVADIPAHTHDVTAIPGGSQNYGEGAGPLASAASAITSTSTGGGGGHSHTLSLDLQYVDVIVATKD